MNGSRRSNEWLMAQIAFDQREYLETLVRRCATPLLTFLQRMVGDPQRSEELFQEVFLALWVKRSQYLFPRPFKPWLYSIAISKCRASCRVRPLAVQLLLEEDPPLTSAASAPSPAEKTAVATETADLVSTAITQLPFSQRVVVVLRIWGGLSYVEIAEIVSRSKNNVRSHMHRGLVTLRKYLESRHMG